MGPLSTQNEHSLPNRRAPRRPNRGPAGEIRRGARNVTVPVQAVKPARANEVTLAWVIFESSFLRAGKHVAQRAEDCACTVFGAPLRVSL